MGAVRSFGASLMKSGLLPALLFFLAVWKTGRSEEEVVFPPRPRLLWTPASLESFRRDPAREPERLALLQQAEKILARGLRIPHGEGDWIFYYACPADGSPLRAESETLHRCPQCGQRYSDERTIGAWRTKLYLSLESDLETLARSWSLSEDQRFFAPIREALLQLARDWPTYTRHDRWGRRGTLAVTGGRRYSQLLDEASSLIRLAGIYDLVADAPSWNPEEQALFESQQLRMPLEEIGRFEQFIHPKNNHQTWFNAAFAAVGLALGHADWLRHGVYGPRGLLKQLETCVSDDGLWHEGSIAYHFYALQAFQHTLDAAQQVGWTFTDNSRLKSMWTAPLQMAFPDGRFHAVHDSNPVLLSEYRTHFRWAADYFGDPGLERADPAALGSTNLMNIGLAVLRRPGCNGSPICAMMKYGPRGDPHGHPAKLNLALYAMGEEILLDPGLIRPSAPPYQTWAQTTIAHNTVVLNQRNQSPDAGRLLYFEERPEGVAALAESRGAYPGAILRRFLILTDHFLVDAFSVNAANTATMDWILHARGELTPPVTLQRRLKPLGEQNGYNHLTRIRSGLYTNAIPVFTFALPNGKRWHLWTPGDEDGTQLFVGTGMGYRPDDPVPFVLRRRETAHTLFLAILDISGCDAVRTVRVRPVLNRQGRPNSTLYTIALDFEGAVGRYRVALDLSEEPATTLLDEDIPFRRWRIEKLSP